MVSLGRWMGGMFASPACLAIAMLGRACSRYGEVDEWEEGIEVPEEEVEEDVPPYQAAGAWN